MRCACSMSAIYKALMSYKKKTKTHNLECHIHNADCVEIMRNMKLCSVDLVVTSPPYDNLRTYEGTCNWTKKEWKRVIYWLKRIIKQGGVIVWIVNDKIVNGSRTGTAFQQAMYFKKLGFKHNDTMIWDKMGFSTMGNLKARYPNQYDFMFVFSRDKAPETFNMLKDRKTKHFTQKIHGYFRDKTGKLIKNCNHGQEIDRFGIRSNVWQESFKHSDRGEHPAPFPLAIAKAHVLSWSNKNDVVFDPFLGSGTTMEAALMTKRNFIGCEIVPKYFEMCKTRMDKCMKELNQTEMDV